MRKKIVDGVSYECPMYLVRAGDGWQIRPPGVRTQYFADALYGGIGPAYNAAFIELWTKDPITGQVRALAERERSNKMSPTGFPGVFRQDKPPRSGKGPEVQLRVSVVQLPARTVYVGTANTGEGRWDGKFAEAGELRDRMVQELTRPLFVPTRQRRRGGSRRP